MLPEFQGVPPIQWLPWIPQLLTCLVRSEGKWILNLLSTVGRMYPQAVYFPIRTLYLTLKIEQRERFNNSRAAAAAAAAMDTTTSGGSAAVGGERRASDSPSGAAGATAASGDQGQQAASADTGGPIRATASMWRCSRIMHFQRDLHPTVLSSLEGETLLHISYSQISKVFIIFPSL